MRALECMEEGQGHEFVHLRGRYPEDTVDQVWLPDLSQEKDWVIVTGDLKMRRTPDVRRAWQEAHLTSFFLSEKYVNSKVWAQFVEVVHWWPTIKRCAQTNDAPRCWKLRWRDSEPTFLEHI